MPAPLVSILIPVYNAAPWLAATIESALAQTHRATELIIIDDGSRDHSLSIAQDYVSDRVRVIHQPNSGAASARNHALQHARGEFIQYLDADDLLAPYKLALQLDLLANSPARSVASCAWARFSTTPESASFFPQPTYRNLSPIEFLRLQCADNQMMPPIAWLTPRALIDEAGPWREDLSLNDDGEFFCRVLLRSTGIRFTPQARAYYRSGNTSSLSHRNDPRALLSLFRSLESNLTALLAYDDSPATRAAVATAWRRLAYDLYPQLPHASAHAEKQSAALGGSALRIEGGKLMRLADRLLGWRAAARLKHLRGS